MWFLALLISLLSLFCGYSADPFVCNSEQTINAPTNISLPVFYPSTWNTSMDAPQYVGGQNCTWTVNIPNGTWVYFQMKANTTNSGVVTITDSIGYVTTLTSIYMEPFFFWAPSFKIDLRAIGSGTMGMRIQWLPVGTFAPNSVKQPANSSPVALDDGFFDNGTVIEVDTQVSILSIPPGRMITDMIPYMKAIQIFDGPDLNSKFRGNLWQVMNSGHNFISTGKYLTLYSVFGIGGIGNIVIAQDYNDVKQFKQYKGVQCFLPNICQISLDATQGTAAAIRYTSDPLYVKEVSMPQTNILSVYNDYVTDSHKLADYTSTTAKTNIPQKFTGRFTTFVLNTDQATIQLSSDNLDSKWSIPFEGRRGFIASPNYGVDTINQTIHEYIQGSQTFNISYNVDRSAIVDGATLTVRIFDQLNTVVDNTYSKTNFPGGKVYAKGSEITVSYNSPSQLSPGAFVSFEFEKYNSAGAYGFLVAIVIALWMSM